MVKNQIKKDRKYMIYTNEYHFIIITIEQIIKNKDKKFIMFIERDLKEYVYKVVKNLEIENKEKEKIMDIFSYRSIEANLKKLTNERNSEIRIFIQGNNKYIEEINKVLDKKEYGELKIDIIDCYNFAENLNMKNLDRYKGKIITDI